MVTSALAQRFSLLFMGKNDTYVKNNLPKVKSGEEGKKVKTEITSCKGKVDSTLLLSHLSGQFAVGVCPVMPDGKCRFGVIDIDSYGSKVKNVLEFIRDYNLPLFPFQSKSGGIHLYFFVSSGIKAGEMRSLLNLVKDTFCLGEIYGKNKVEVFPKQDKLSEGSFGSTVTLPYFNADDTYTYLLDTFGNPVSLEQALFFIQRGFSSPEALKKALDSLPYNDAPPCIQRLFISKYVGEDSSGRNNFLFSFAVYAAKKFGTDDFESHVREVNSFFSSPVDEKEIAGIVSSVKSHEYSYKCKDIPLSSCCSKMLCRKREFGLGGEKGHFSDIEYGQLLRYRAAEPYYVWKLRLLGSEDDFRNIVFRDEKELLDQKNFAKVCVRYLNFAPRQVQTNDWFGTLNKYLASVKEVEVSAESDTSVLSELRGMFVKYLANKQSRRDSPYQIHAGLCVRQTFTDEEGVLRAKFFFTHTGFTEYLKVNRVAFDSIMLREILLGFGAKEDTLLYTNAAGELVEFHCWSKEEDSVIDSAYKSEVELELGDRARSVSEVYAEEEEGEGEGEEEPLYTDEDERNIDF